MKGTSLPQQIAPIKPVNTFPDLSLSAISKDFMQVAICTPCGRLTARYRRCTRPVPCTSALARQGSRESLPKMIAWQLSSCSRCQVLTQDQAHLVMQATAGCCRCDFTCIERTLKNTNLLLFHTGRCLSSLVRHQVAIHESVALGQALACGQCVQLSLIRQQPIIFV